MAITLTPGMNRLPASNPQAWEEACDECGEEVGHRSFPHVVIFTEDGKLLAGTECGQKRFQYALAGHLALAGVRVGPAGNGACELLDKEQLQHVIESLHDAGADVTVAQT